MSTTKRSWSKNVGKRGGFDANSHVTKIPIEKSGYTDQARMRRVMNPTRSGQGVPAPGQSLSAPGQSLSAPRQSLSAPGQSLPANSGHRTPTRSVQHVPAQSKQHVRAQSEKGQSGESSQNESRQLTAQSRQHTPQHTPENQSRQHQHTPEGQLRQPAIGAQAEQIENAPILSHQSMLNVSSVPANGNVRWDIGLEHLDGRVRLEVIKGTLEPSGTCSKRNRLIMYERLEPTGYNWKCVSKETKEFYFEEFKKYFVWRQPDGVIYKGWLANARRKYSEVLSNARGDWEYRNKQDNRIGLDVYASWVEFWKTEDFKKISTIQKGNRCSGVDGRPSTHTSGSASFRTVAARMKLQYKRDPTPDEVFYLTHTRRVKKKKNPIAEAREIGLDDVDDQDVEGGEDEENFEVVWVDKKSQQIYETFVALLELQEKSGQPVDRKAVFLEAVGGFDKKKRLYGVGSSQGLFYENTKVPCISFPSHEEENERLKQQLSEMNNRMMAMEKQLAVITQSTSIRFGRPQTPTSSSDGGQEGEGDSDGQEDDSDGQEDDGQEDDSDGDGQDDN